MTIELFLIGISAGAAVFLLGWLFWKLIQGISWMIGQCYDVSSNDKRVRELIESHASGLWRTMNDHSRYFSSLNSRFIAVEEKLAPKPKSKRK